MVILTLFITTAYTKYFKIPIAESFSSISGLEKYPLERFKNNIVIYDDKMELEKTHNLIKSKFSTEEIMKQLAVSKKI